MFYPNFTVRTFDRNIFGNVGEVITVRPKFHEPIELLFYYQGNIGVGAISGDLELTAFKSFIREGFLPVRIMHKGEFYCGWLNLKEIDLILS